MDKNFILVSLFSILAFTSSCTNSSEKAETDHQLKTEIQNEVVSEAKSEVKPEEKSEAIPKEKKLYIGDNSATSVDWNGTYKGTVPCASCEGIETILTLNMDMTFKLSTHYFGRNDALEEDVMGDFEWDDTGSIVTLGSVRDRPNQFKIGENRIWQLDMDGNMITDDLADHYILTKQ